MFQAPETKYARSGDTYIAYQVVGEGPIDLLYIPGWTYSHVDLIWEWPLAADYLRRLASFSRLIIFDKRGIGASDRQAKVPTIENHLDDVNAVLDAAGSDEAAIFGFSEGGALALLFAATYPSRVRALVTYGSFARVLRADDYPWGLPAKLVPGLRSSLRELWGTGVELSVFAPSAADNEEAVKAQARLTRAAASPSAALSYFDMLVQIDIRHVLPTIQTPTLVIHRRDDRAVRWEASRFLADQIQGARFLELEGENHIPWFDDYTDLVEAVQEFLTGARPAPRTDRVLATVLFSDLVASTEKAAAVGDSRWRTLLDSVDDIVREHVEGNRGRVVKTMGDGHLATFDGPARAIQAAQAIRAGIRPLGLQCRIGLHCGEVEVRGDDVGGIGVHIGARISRLAAPEEILVSRTLADLVVGSGFGFESLGDHDLKGVPGTWEVLAVTD